MKNFEGYLFAKILLGFKINASKFLLFEKEKKKTNNL